MPLITQLQVLEHLLQGGGVCRLRVRNQAKALHRAPDHSRKQHDFTGPGSDAPDPSLAVGDVILSYSIL